MNEINSIEYADTQEESILNALPGEDRCLFLFAHPDDDSFIAGAMHELLNSGVEVHAAWLTSGGLLGGKATREKELAQATSIIGLADWQTHKLRFPDLGLTESLDQAAQAVADLAQELAPTLIFATAFEGGHPDHDCVNFAAYEGVRRSGRPAKLFEFPLYNGSGPVRHWRWKINRFPPGAPATEHFPLSDEAIRVKYATMRAYSSQWMYMFPARLSSPRSRMKDPGEPYRPCPPNRDHTVRPHSGSLNYERWFNRFMGLTFEDYCRSVEAARAASS